MARYSEIIQISSFRELDTYWNGTPFRDVIKTASHTYSTDLRSDVIKSPNNGRGWRDPLPYSREVFKIRGPRGYMAYHDSAIWSVTGDHHYSLVPSQDAKPGFSQSAVDSALSKAMLKIKDCDFSASVTLGEARETAELIATTATRIRKGFTSLRHGNIGGFKKALGINRKHSLPIPRTGDAVAGAWLEHSYAWTPLLGDVDNAAKALARRDEPPVISARTKAKDNSAYVFDSGKGKPSPPTYSFNCSSTVEKLALCRLDFEPGNYALAKAKSLGLTNPLEVAWELLPFSFVADWFVPVGDFISCFDYATGLKYKSGSMTMVVRHWRKAIGSPYGYHYIANNAEGSLYYMKMNRVIYQTKPFPPPPPIKNPFSTKHVADALALLMSAFLSSRPIR